MRWISIKVGMFLQNCLMQLLSQKTVVFATHQVEFLDAADIVLVSYWNYFIVHVP
jgi:ABC-type transport system involved in cytochrome bd biosynthesis fused ATPase/permease subunit